MAILIEVLVKTVGYFLVFLGVIRMARPLLVDSLRLYGRSRRMRNQQSTDSEKNHRGEIFKHLQTIIYSLSKTPNEAKVWNFIGISAGLFLSTVLTVSILTKEYVLAVILGLLFTSLPYAVIRFRLANHRIEASVAFMNEFHIFLQSFQKHKDVYHTVFESARLIRDKRLKKAFNRLLSSIQKERSEEAFVEAIHLFSFSVGSSFASRFSNLLVKSYREQIDVSEAMMDLHMDMRKREKDMAEVKTKQLETIFVGYMPIVILPIFIYLAYKMTMMYSNSFVFDQSASLVGLLFAFFLAIVCALCAYLMGKPRADL